MKKCVVFLSKAMQVFQNRHLMPLTSYTVKTNPWLHYKATCLLSGDSVLKWNSKMSLTFVNVWFFYGQVFPIP